MMEIAHRLAGFTMVEVDELKETVRHKDEARMAAMKTKFFEGCSGNNIDIEDTQEIWDMIEKQSGYLFNRSHAVAYSMLTYQTAMLKAHYPQEFMCALIRTVDATTKEGKAKRLAYLAETHELGFKILRPSANRSDVGAIPVGRDKIRLGFIDIHGIAAKSATKLVASRNGGFKNLHDVEECGTESIIKALAKAGALSEFGVTTTKRVASEACGWDFDDQLMPYKLKLKDKLRMPPDATRCLFPGLIVKSENRRSQAGNTYRQWEVQIRPGYSVTVRVFAQRLWDLQEGSIVQIKGKYDAEFRSILIGGNDADTVRVLVRKEA
jgi:hypothetical protein